MRIPHIVAAIMTALFLSLDAAAASTFTKPDFAFPQKVGKQAEAQLKSARRSGNAPATVRALIDLTLADNMVSADKAPDAIKRIEECLTASRKPQEQAVLNLLLARVFTDLYLANRWVYDRRTLPPTPVPDNFNEWSGEQFRTKITALTEAALSNPSALLKSPLTEWKGVITQDNLTLIYYPSLLDFASSVTVDILTSITRSHTPLPLRCLTIGGAGATPAFAKGDTGRILSVYDAWVNLNEGHSKPAFANAAVHRLLFLCENTNGGYSRRFDMMMKLADSLADSEWAGEALIAAGHDGDNRSQNRELLRRVTAAVKAYPSYPRINTLKNIAAEITRPAMSVTSPTCVAPQTPVKLEVSLENAPSGYIDVYRVYARPGDHYFSMNARSRYEKVGRIDVSGADSVPSFTKSTLSYTFAKPGVYAFVPVCSTKSERNQSFPLVYVTRLALLATTGSSPAAWVVNPADGSPVEGADVSLLNYNKSPLKLGVTDAQGSVGIPVRKDDIYGNLLASKSGDTSAPLFYSNYTGESVVNDSTFSAHIYTALPLYHPGDTLEFSSFIIKTTPQGNSLAPSKTVKATVMDANYLTVDTLTLTTDRWGRVAGRFALPSDRLQGRWQLRMSVDDRIAGSASFTVSDYRLPTFNVELQQPLKLADGSFKVSGTARLYSGYPAAECPVMIALSGVQRFAWWNPAPEEAFYTTETTTDASGNFTVTLTGQILDDSPWESGFFSVTATVTLTTGESREASVTFADGNPVQLIASMAANTDISSPVALNAKTFNSQHEAVKTDISYSVSRGDSTLIAPRPLTGPAVDWSALPSGPATVRFTAAGDTVTCRTIFYKPSDKTSPSTELLWTPQDTLRSDNKLLLGVHKATHVLYLLTEKDSVLQQKWLKLDAGMHHLDVKLPDGCENATLRLGAYADYSSSQLNVVVRKPVAPTGISLDIESFRDRLTPGSRETWKIRVADALGHGIEAAVLLDMWNKSLSQLATPSFDFTTPTGFRNRMRLIAVDYNDATSTSTGAITPLKVQPVFAPEFETWGQSFMSGTIHIRGVNQFKAMATSRKASSDGAMPEVLEEVAMEADTYAAPAAGAADKGNLPAGKTEDKFSYRDGETPLALFEPTLTTDADGSLTYSFTVPDANATWVLNALAVSPELKVAEKQLTAVASKQVMVQPSLPRFMRAGDVVAVPALVINNSDSDSSVETVVEFYNAITGATIATRSFTNNLAAGKSATITTEITAPTDVTLLGYRIKARMGAFADGEQDAVAVLPSTTRVIESSPFYMSPDSTSLSLDIPAPGTDASVTLTFCENPLWLVVSALPGLLEGSPRTAPEAASQIYSAAIASSILRSNPAIGRALKEWTASPTDSTLVSMLERNSQLKSLMLQATPWISDAKSDTERMTRLALLFDRSNIDAAITSGVKALAKLVDRGGLKWSEGSREASQWATMRVLDLMGRLNSSSRLPDNAELRRQITEAVKWLDAEVADDYRRSPHGNYTGYVAVRDRFPAIRQSTASARVTDATVQQLIGRWRDLGSVEKARAAMILENHNYHATALQILASLREFAMTSPEKGMWWPRLTENYASGMTANTSTAVILEAFAIVSPGCPDVDKIRQWLILQKEGQNWGTGDDTSTLVAAILSTSDKWIAPARGATVTVGGKTVDTGTVEKALGSFTADITADVTPKGARLSVTRPGDTPSWGAVVSVFTDTITSVKARGIDGLSIEKRLYRIMPDGSAANIDGPLSLGTKVKVELLIKCDRALDYVAVTDERPACFSPVDQLPGYVWSEGIGFYRVNADTSTALLIDSLPKGTYLLSYEMWVTSAGRFISGVATVQSQYAPALTAHSSGSVLNVAER